MSTPSDPKFLILKDISFVSWGWTVLIPPIKISWGNTFNLEGTIEVVTMEFCNISFSTSIRFLISLLFAGWKAVSKSMKYGRLLLNIIFSSCKSTAPKQLKIAEQ